MLRLQPRHHQLFEALQEGPSCSGGFDLGDRLPARPGLALDARDETLDLVVHGRDRDLRPQHEVAVRDAERGGEVMLHLSDSQ